MCQQGYYTRCIPSKHKKDKCCECNAKVGNIVQIAVAVATDGGNASATNGATNVVIGNKVCTGSKRISPPWGDGPGPVNAAYNAGEMGDGGLELRITTNGEVYLNGQMMPLEEAGAGVRSLKVES